MIDLNLLIALISFYFVMYVTPGPNNAMVLASGLKFGFLKTIPHMSGITIGHITQLILVCFGLGKIFQIFPEIQSILKIMCALYLLYLGYKIIGSFSKIREDDSRPLKFYEAALFQIVNPKAWTISSMAASGFLPKEREWLDQFLKLGFIDTFREINPNPHCYSWWSYRAQSRKNNKGWRIDYHMLSKNLKNSISDARILHDVHHSDHCPILVELK